MREAKPYVPKWQHLRIHGYTLEGTAASVAKLANTPVEQREPDAISANVEDAERAAELIRVIAEATAPLCKPSTRAVPPMPDMVHLQPLQPHGDPQLYELAVRLGEASRVALHLSKWKAAALRPGAVAELADAVSRIAHDLKAFDAPVIVAAVAA